MLGITNLYAKITNYLKRTNKLLPHLQQCHKLLCINIKLWQIY